VGLSCNSQGGAHISSTIADTRRAGNDQFEQELTLPAPWRWRGDGRGRKRFLRGHSNPAARRSINGLWRLLLIRFEMVPVFEVLGTSTVPPSKGDVATFEFHVGHDCQLRLRSVYPTRALLTTGSHGCGAAGRCRLERWRQVRCCTSNAPVGPAASDD